MLRIEKAGGIGFCFGVRRAINMVEKAARERGKVEQAAAHRGRGPRGARARREGHRAAPGGPHVDDRPRRVPQPLLPRDRGHPGRHRERHQDAREARARDPEGDAEAPRAQAVRLLEGEVQRPCSAARQKSSSRP